MKLRLVSVFGLFAGVGLLGQLATLYSQPASLTNRVLELDGTNSFVELPPNIFTNLTEATVEGWVKWRDFRNMSRFFDFGDVWHSLNVQNRLRDGMLYFEVVPDTDEVHSLSVAGILHSNEWVHVAAVSGKPGMQLYLNGVLLATNHYGGSFNAINSGKHNYLGRSNWKGQPSAENEDFDGQMDEVRVWRVARTEEQIRQAMFQRLTGREEGLVGLWNFDDGRAGDATPAGHHGKLVGQAHTVAAELPTPEHLQRPAVIYGHLLNWRQNPEGWGYSFTFVRLQQAGHLVSIVSLQGGRRLRFPPF
jgi:Concanavalin A-like lectin/glucanases superfamily